MDRDSRTMRVCNVDEEGRFGGPERRIVQIAKALKSLGIETCVVFPQMESELFQAYIIENGIEFIRVDITRLSKQKKVLLRYVTRFILEIYKLARIFRKEKFDLVHVNGSYQFKVAIAAKLSGSPVIWHLNDTYAPSLLKRVFSIVARACADGYIVAGQRVQEYYLSGTKMELLPRAEIHAPVNLDVFDPAGFKQETKDSVSVLRVGTVSSVNPAKGLEYFVEVVAGLLAVYPKIEFVVAGSILESQKKYYDSIMKKMSSLGLTSDNVRFVGLIEDVPAFISQLDICVFTSVTEASPTSVWEAMAMAKPVVTTDAGSVRQYIEQGVSGFVVPVGDVDQLVTYTGTLIENEGLRESMGIAARRVAEHNLSTAAAAQQHASIYRQIVDSLRQY